MFIWRRTAVRLLSEPAFSEVRLNRNREKISIDDQRQLRTKRIGVVGLSVGHAIALILAQEGLCSEIRIADFDHLSLSNLNRLRTSVVNLSVAKSTITRREILEIDPYLSIKTFPNGINDDSIEDFMVGGGKLDLVVEECDSLEIKIRVREVARKHRIPVVMDTSDRGMIDLERYDLEPDYPVLHAKLGGIDSTRAKSLNGDQRNDLIDKILGGKENMSVELYESLQRIGKDLLGFPQLASDVHLGGALVAFVARKVLLGEPLKSGRHYVDLAQIIS